MAATDHDAYIADVTDDAKRAALTALRAMIGPMLPDCVECISYAMPAFRQPGKKGQVVVGYAAFSKHCAIYPHSGNVMPQLTEVLAGWKVTKAGVLFTPDHPLPAILVQRIIDARLAEITAK